MDTHELIARWHDAVARRDLAGLELLLAEDVRFDSPAVFHPVEGRGPTMLVLAAATDVFGPLVYEHTYLDGEDGATLQFRTTVAGDDGRPLDVEGVDVLRVGRDGRVVSLTVMLRPLSALQATASRMREQLGL